jgi:hypothetical protein
MELKDAAMESEEASQPVQTSNLVNETRCGGAVLGEVAEQIRRLVPDEMK